MKNKTKIIASIIDYCLDMSPKKNGMSASAIEYKSQKRYHNRIARKKTKLNNCLIVGRRRGIPDGLARGWIVRRQIHRHVVWRRRQLRRLKRRTRHVPIEFLSWFLLLKSELSLSFRNKLFYKPGGKSGPAWRRRRSVPPSSSGLRTARPGRRRSG